MNKKDKKPQKRYYILVGDEGTWKIALQHLQWGFSQKNIGLWNTINEDEFVAFYVTKPIQKIIINLINLAVLAVISWQLWIKAGDAAEYGDRTEYLFMPLSPLLIFMSIMTGIAGLILFFIMINSLKMEK